MRFDTIKNQPFIVYAKRDAAAQIAAANNADDDGTEYRVVEREDGRFVIAVYDGDHRLGLL